MASDASGLETLDRDSYAPPQSRIKDVYNARSRIEELKLGDDIRSEFRAILAGLIDGNPPYNRGRMESMGRGDDANINFREGEGRVAAAATPYYELCRGVPRAADIKVYWDKNENKQKEFEWGNLISDAYSEVLWGWKGYKKNMQVSQYQMVLFGRGPILWSRKRGWHFEAKRDDSVWVADDADCDLDKLAEMAIPDHFNPVELFNLMDDAPEDSGWNEQIAKDAIINAAPKTFRDTFRHNWADYQESLRRGDTLWNNRICAIRYYHYLVKEFSGKITHAMVLEMPQSDKKKGSDDFLYLKEGKYESFHDIINPFFFDVGPGGEWYSVKGLGPKIFDICDLNNRMYCTLINAAVAGAGVALQAVSGSAMQKIQQQPIVRASGATFYPPDWQVIEKNLASPMDGPLAVLAKVNNVIESNTGQYQQLDDTPQPTLGQEQILASSRSTLTRGAYDRYCDYLDDMHEQIVKRMLDPSLTEDDPGGKEALEMREKLIADGVPPECLKFENICSIKAVRAPGLGSPQMQQVVSQNLLQRLGTMDPEGRQNALRWITAGEVGQSNVDQFYKPFEELGIPNDQQAQAGMENVLMRTPGASQIMQVTPGMDHLTHFESHMKHADNAVQALQAGAIDPQSTSTILENTGVHGMKHLQELQGDPTKKNEAQQGAKMLVKLGQTNDQIKKDMANSANQQQQPQIPPELGKNLADFALKKQHNELNHQAKMEDMQFKHHIKDLETADKINRKHREDLAGV